MLNIPPTRLMDSPSAFVTIIYKDLSYHADSLESCACDSDFNFRICILLQNVIPPEISIATIFMTAVDDFDGRVEFLEKVCATCRP